MNQRIPSLSRHYPINLQSKIIMLSRGIVVLDDKNKRLHTSYLLERIAIFQIDILFRVWNTKCIMDQGGSHHEGPPQSMGDFLKDAPPRLTAQDAERAKAKERAAFTQLMDDMEASTAKQGQWFVKLGEKKPVTGTQPVQKSRFMGMGKRTVDQEVTSHEDSRALILKAPLVHNTLNIAQRDVLFVTPDGIRVVRFYPNDLENPNGDAAIRRKQEYELLMKILSGQITPDETSRYTTERSISGFQPRIESKAGFNDKQTPGYPSAITLDFPTDPSRILEDFHETALKSIELAEAPHRERVTAANHQAQVAHDAADMLRKLPPR